MSKDLMQVYKNFYTKYSDQYGPNTCILMMVGKFYELYALYKDELTPVASSVKRATELMNIVLKEFPNDNAKGETRLWSGFPEQSLHKFAQTMTKEGWVVVVVDQVKGSHDMVIDRVPVRILSPGTHIETAGQDRMSVAGLWIEGGNYATSVLDIMTGETYSFYTQQADQILHMFQVFGVKEVSACSTLNLDESAIRSLFSIQGILQKVPVADMALFADAFRREEFMRRMFRIKSMMPLRTSLQLDQAPVQMERSLTLLLRFVEDHFPNLLQSLTSHIVWLPNQYMRLSNNVLEQLNMITNTKQKSVLSILEKTYSAIGKRALRERMLRPITDPVSLEKRWEQVDFVITMDIPVKKQVERALRGLYDLPRLHHSIASGTLQAYEVQQLGWSYQATASLIRHLENTPLAASSQFIYYFQEYREHFERLIDEAKANLRIHGELIGFLTPIGGPRSCEMEAKIVQLHAEWETIWSAFATPLSIPIDAFQRVQKGDDGWIWEGPRSLYKIINAAKENKKLNDIQLDVKKAGPIALQCKEFTKYTGKLDQIWRTLNSTLKEEVRILCDDLWSFLTPIKEEWVEWLGTIDATFALATIAKELSWCRPTLGKGLEAVGLRHPLLEGAVTRVAYVAHDVKLGNNQPGGWLIYGVNASGKSSLMKSVGIAVLLAQAGSFVPATSFSLRPYDAIFSRIWSHDNVWAGLSSFAVEVSELRDILSCATGNSLVLGDEVCSGTESTSATSLVAAVLEHLDNIGAHSMFATHLHDLLTIPGLFPRPGIAVWHLRVDRTPDGKLIYDRRLQPGPGSASYGLEVARAMGLPIPLMDRAYAIRRSLEGTSVANSAPVSSWNAKIQRQVCEVCGNNIVRNLEVHHIVQRADGGTNDLRNLAVLCESCHDKHHAGEIEVGPLVITSDGLERATTTSVISEVVQTKAKGKRGTTIEWSEEQQEIIQKAVSKHKGRPLTRIIAECEEGGVTISNAQLKKCITAWNL